MLPKQEEPCCIEAAQVELKKILSQIRNLEDAENDIICECENPKKRCSKLTNERSEIESLINSELKPRVATLRKTLNKYRFSIEIYNEQSVIERFEDTMKSDLSTIEIEGESEIKYKPKEYFDCYIMNQINNIITNILKACNFDNFSSAYFSLETFDAVVNGKDKFKY